MHMPARDFKISAEKARENRIKIKNIEALGYTNAEAVTHADTYNQSPNGDFINTIGEKLPKKPSLWKPFTWFGGKSRRKRSRRARTRRL